MDKRIALAAATALSFLSASVACAQDAPGATREFHSKEFDACVAKSGSVDFAIAECTATETARQDKRLNAAYHELISRSDSARKAALQKAERAWMAYRDAQCAYEYAAEEGGTLARVFYASCRLNLTVKRLENLKAMLGR